MAYPSKFKALEQKFGKPIGEILVEKLNELRDISKVARHPDIDMTYANIYDKVQELGIEKNVTWRLPEPEHAE